MTMISSCRDQKEITFTQAEVKRLLRKILYVAKDAMPEKDSEEYIKLQGLRYSGNVINIARVGGIVWAVDTVLAGLEDIAECKRVFQDVSTLNPPFKKE